MNNEIEEKLRIYGFVCTSSETEGGVWEYGEGEDALKLFIFSNSHYLIFPKNSRMKKKTFQTRGFPENLIEKHICLSVVKE